MHLFHQTTDVHALIQNPACVASLNGTTHLGMMYQAGLHALPATSHTYYSRTQGVRTSSCLVPILGTVDIMCATEAIHHTVGLYAHLEKWEE